MNTLWLENVFIDVCVKFTNIIETFHSEEVIHYSSKNFQCKRFLYPIWQLIKIQLPAHCGEYLYLLRSYLSM